MPRTNNEQPLSDDGTELIAPLLTTDESAETATEIHEQFNQYRIQRVRDTSPDFVASYDNLINRIHLGRNNSSDELTLEDDYDSDEDLTSEEQRELIDLEYEDVPGEQVSLTESGFTRFTPINLVINSRDQVYILDRQNGKVFRIGETEQATIRSGGTITFNSTLARNSFDPEATETYRTSSRAIRQAESDLRHYTDRQNRRQSDSEDEQEELRFQQVQRSIQRIIENNRNTPVTAQNNSMCALCHVGIRTVSPNQTAHETAEGWVCRRCYGVFEGCNICGKAHHPGALVSSSTGNICEKCVTERSFGQCVGCDTYFQTEDLRSLNESTLCPDCYQLNNQSMPRNNGEIWRRYQSRKLFSMNSNDVGEIVKSSRIFSVEIECQYPSGNVFSEVSQKLPRPLGVAHDGSISGNGVEFQTPKLSGKKGEGFINKVCGILNEASFKTDRSCGMHIHIDGAHDFTPMGSFTAFMNIRNLFAFYFVFEDVIASFLPLSRRRNNYCLRVGEAFSLREIMDASSRRELEALWYRTEDTRDVVQYKQDRHHNSRYHGFNLHSLLAQNHLEIRFHSGTTSFRKMAEWVNLHLLIVDGITKGTITADSIRGARDFVKLEEKIEYMFDLIELSESSRQYFMQRVEKFGKKANSHLEEADLVIAQ